MEIFQNPTPELLVSYVTNIVLLIVTAATLILNSRSNKKNRESARELEILKSKMEFDNEYKKQKIAHVNQLLNYVYAIRIAADEVKRTKSADKLSDALIHFKNYYHSNADKTNALEDIARNYAHDIFVYHGKLEYCLKNLGMKPQASQDEIEVLYRDISRFSKIYEDMLRSEARILSIYRF